MESELKVLCSTRSDNGIKRDLDYSMRHSTGQPRRFLGLVQRTVERRAVLLAFEGAFGTTERNLRTISLRVLSGCDFVTPFGYGRCPACKFCGAAKIRTQHLLFNCHGLSGSGSTGKLPLFFDA